MNQIISLVREKIRYQVRDEIVHQVTDQIKNQVIDRLWNRQIWGQIFDSFSNQIKNQVELTKT